MRQKLTRYQQQEARIDKLERRIEVLKKERDDLVKFIERREMELRLQAYEREREERNKKDRAWIRKSVNEFKEKVINDEIRDA